MAPLAARACGCGRASRSTTGGFMDTDTAGVDNRSRHRRGSHCDQPDSSRQIFLPAFSRPAGRFHAGLGSAVEVRRLERRRCAECCLLGLFRRPAAARALASFRAGLERERRTDQERYRPVHCHHRDQLRRDGGVPADSRLGDRDLSTARFPAGLAGPLAASTSRLSPASFSGILAIISRIVSRISFPSCGASTPYTTARRGCV